MATPTPDPWVYLVGAFLSAGGVKYIYDAVRAWRATPPVELRTVGIIDANIAVIARARDELGEDVVRLREMLLEERAQRMADENRHAMERARWLSDQERLRADVARLEKQIQDERREANRRYDALLAQVNRLGARTTEMEDRRDG